MSDSALKKKAAQISLLVLDVDGTLTDGGVYIDANGLQSKKFHIRDGMGITLLHEKGIRVGIISHSRSKTILDERARMLKLPISVMMSMILKSSQKSVFPDVHMMPISPL